MVNDSYLRLWVAVMLAAASVGLVFRLVSRWPWKEKFGRDDGLAIAGSCGYLAQGLIIIVLASRGFNRDPNTLAVQDKQYFARMIYITDLLFVFVLYASRLSASITIWRLTHQIGGPQDTRAKALMAACGFSFLVSIGVVAGQHGAPAPQLHHEQSAKTYTATAWILYMVSGSVLDLIIAVYPSCLVYHMQMSRWSKAKVLLGYGPRIFVVVIAAMRIRSLAMNDRDTFPKGYIEPELWTQGEMCCGLLAATLPCLKKLLVNAKTGLYQPPEPVDSWTGESWDSVQMKPLPVRLRDASNDAPPWASLNTVSAITGGRNVGGSLPEAEPGTIEVRQEFHITRSDNMAQFDFRMDEDYIGEVEEHRPSPHDSMNPGEVPHAM